MADSTAKWRAEAIWVTDERTGRSKVRWVVTSDDCGGALDEEQMFSRYDQARDLAEIMNLREKQGGKR